MSLSIQQLLENKGITPKPEHLELLKHAGKVCSPFVAI